MNSELYARNKEKINQTVDHLQVNCQDSNKSQHKWFNIDRMKKTLCTKTYKKVDDYFQTYSIYIHKLENKKSINCDRSTFYVVNYVKNMIFVTTNVSTSLIFHLSTQNVV